MVVKGCNKQILWTKCYSISWQDCTLLRIKNLHIRVRSIVFLACLHLYVTFKDYNVTLNQFKFQNQCPAADQKLYIQKNILCSITLYCDIYNPPLNCQNYAKNRYHKKCTPNDIQCNLMSFLLAANVDIGLSSKFYGQSDAFSLCL